MKINILNIEASKACPEGVAAFQDVFGDEAYLSNVLGFYWAYLDEHVDHSRYEFDQYNLEDWTEWLFASIFDVEDVCRFAIKILDLVIEFADVLVDEVGFESDFKDTLELISQLYGGNTYSVAMHLIGFCGRWCIDMNCEIIQMLEDVING